MSLENCRAIIDHALEDAAYLERLLADPNGALQGVELNDAETTMLSGLSSGPYTSTRRGLMETRKLIQAAIEFGGAEC